MIALILLAVSPIFVKLIMEWVQPNDKLTLKSQKKYDKIFLIICGILITLIMGLRGRKSGSLDTNMYCKFFSDVARNNNLRSYLAKQIEGEIFLFSEVGFSLFMWLLSRITVEPQALIFTTSAFIVYSTMRFIYKNSDDVFLAVILFLCLGLFTFNMNGMRQAMAMSICLWAYEFAKNKKPVKFLLLVLVATLFHKTAIVFLLVYFIKYLKFNTKSMLFLITLFIIIAVLNPVIVKYFDDIYDKSYSESESRTGGGIIQLAIYLGTVLLAIVARKSLSDDAGKDCFYLLLLALYFFILRYIGTQIFERISYYFAYFLILMLPKTIKHAERKEKPVLMFLSIFLSIGLFIYRVNGNFSNFYLCFI